MAAGLRLHCMSLAGSWRVIRQELSQGAEGPNRGVGDRGVGKDVYTDECVLPR